jgi:hypothetical protein
VRLDCRGGVFAWFLCSCHHDRMTDEHYNNAADAIFVASPTAGEGANCGGSHFVGAHIAVSFVLEVLSPAHQRPTVGEQVELAQ